MAVFAIGDVHLSLDTDKSMDVFRGWEDYVRRLEENWRSAVGEQDTVVLVGDISWALGLSEAGRDLAFINALPGKKLLMKGNHDYWWSTRSKMEHFFHQQDFSTLSILHNSATEAEGMVLCGSRGWLFEKGEAHDRKLVLREAARLDMSLTEGARLSGELVAFLHYPPVFGNELTPEIIEVLHRHSVRRCYYGHIHSESCRYALNGEYAGIDFRLCSADFLGFRPMRVAPGGAAEFVNSE